MPLEFVSGDLFANRFGAQALAHGCNCQGSMGAGIATGFRDRYPTMFAEYRRRCKADPREFNLGDAFLWTADGPPSVFNLGTQEGVWRARASYPAIEAALRAMRERADRERITSVAMPRVGAGYGGLSWPKVRAVIEAVFGDWPGTLYVYEDYASGGEHSAGRAEGVTMPIVVESRRKKRATVEGAWSGALVLDVTSRGEEPWVRFSPFYPHGGIPVPDSPGVLARSVEGLWQGLKVFEHEDIDPTRWQVSTMKGIKRAAGGKRGRVLGHRLGVGGSVLLGYRDARHRIYLPAYRWVLENRLVEEMGRLRAEVAARAVVLLDYETNEDVEDLSRPLSHAALVKCFLEGT
jgi:O-acetyl-ADP-ribose deacetylase (regulator of RNase III)